jgi:hypothetical protein
MGHIKRRHKQLIRLPLTAFSGSNEVVTTAGEQIIVRRRGFDLSLRGQAVRECGNNEIN